MDERKFSSDDIVNVACELLVALHKKRPRVHCITNAAAQVMTANLLLAAGALPSLTYSADEISDFTKSADALLINLGTLDAERRAAIPLAIEVARDQETPWILDPVFVNASAPRLFWANQLFASRPAIVRCNRDEFKALSGQTCELTAIERFAAFWGTTVAVTGPEDMIIGDGQCIHISNGHPWMNQTTAMGCAGTALSAALCAVGASPFVAASAALLILGITGERAADRSSGPGSFVAAFIDTVASLTPDDIIASARISA